MSLVDIHGYISDQDSAMEKQAEEEFSKLAEEDAAGRIMARGFMDELNKVAGGFGSAPMAKRDPNYGNKVRKVGPINTSSAAKAGAGFKPSPMKRPNFSGGISSAGKSMTMPYDYLTKNKGPGVKRVTQLGKSYPMPGKR